MSAQAPDEVLCPCTGTTRQKIKTLAEEGFSLDDISRKTGIFTGCGGCEWDVADYYKAVMGDANPS
jgi:bacterioferritin-associated ferredoxin